MIPHKPTLPPFKYKPQQQLALDYDGNIAVSAGAGSGKTRVLVEKYFRLLAYQHPDWPVDSVVAITFTVKAAGELRARIVKRIRDELAEPKLSDALRTRLLEMRREIAGAPIGTIHNFCSRVLREFAFEARLNPDFQIVEGAHESSLRRDAVQAAVGAAARTPGTQLYTDLLVLLSLYSRGHLYRILESMLKRRAEFAAPVTRFTTTPTDHLFQELVEYHESQASQKRERLVQDLASALRRLLDIDPEGEAGRQAQFLWAKYENVLHSGVAWTQLCSLSSEVQKALFTLRGELLSKVEKQSSVQRGHEVLQHLWELCCDCHSTALKQPGPEDRENLEVSAMLARLYQLADTLYANSRGAAASADEVDLLDFADLEILAERLITESTKVRRRLRERVKYLIVDEFQDTSEIQWRILGPVVSAEDGTLLPRRFFMVGDPKQGVYGFRQASTRIFNHVRQLVVSSNEGRGGECQGDISINYNFRTLPRPLNIVNELFSSLMQPQKTGVEEVVFEALIPERAECEGGFDMLVATEAADVAPADAAVGCTDEVEQVVSKLAAYLAEEGRAAGDVAILLRKRKHFDSYERALRARAIPYLTHRGKGLYEQPEALAVLAVLRLAAAPDADTIAAEVARGPLINFTDDLLLKVGLTPGPSFLEKCFAAVAGARPEGEGSRIQFTEAELERVQQLTHLHSALQKRVGLVQIESLIQQILAQTGAEAIFGVGERAGQALANLRRLVEIARSLRTDDLDEFLTYVDSELFDTGGQGEAAEDMDQSAAVRIMTIHAAKGLEFPVVFLPELADPIQIQRESIMTDGEQWMAVRKSMSMAKEDLFLPSYLEERKKERAAGEEKRVLYVAMTRCRDQLVLSCTSGGKKEKDSFYGWIAPHLQRIGVAATAPEQPTGLPQTQPFPNRKVALHDSLFTARLAACTAAAGERQDPGKASGAPFAPPALLPVEPNGRPTLEPWLVQTRKVAQQALRALKIEGLEAALSLIEPQLSHVALPLPASQVLAELQQSLRTFSCNPEVAAFLLSPGAVVGATLWSADGARPVEHQIDCITNAGDEQRFLYVGWMESLSASVHELAAAHKSRIAENSRVLFYDGSRDQLTFV